MSFNLRPGTSLFGNVTFTPGTNENYVAPPVHGGPVSTNIALTATSTASTHISDRPPSLAHDGIIGISDTDGSTISGVNAWVTTGEGVGAWMQLDWSTPQTVNKIKLYDRPNVTHDHIKGGTLTFSDGSSVTVGELPDGVVNGSPDPLEVTFDAKTITWVRFTVDAFTGHNAGLTEFEVFGYEYQAPAPEPAPASEPQILPLSSAVSLLMDASATADGSVVDGSTNNHSITVNGDVTQSSFSPYRSGGYSWEFDGSGDQLSFSHAGFGTGDFTAEGWVFPENQGNRFPLCFEFGTLISVQYDREDIPGKFIVGGLQAADNCPSGQWYHIAAVRESGTLTLYVNGVAADSKTHTDDLSAHTAFIGGSSGVSSELAFKGKMSDVRFTNAAVYTTDFTPPTERLTELADTSQLICNLPYMKSGVTVAGDTTAVPTSPYDYAGYSESLHGGSYVFDGSSRLTLSSQFHVTGEFALETWVNLDNTDTFISGTLDGSNVQILRIKQGYAYFTHRAYQSFNNMTVGILEDGGLRGNTLLNTGQWYHLALTRDSNNTLRIFVNGQLDAEATWSHDFNFNTIGSLSSNLAHHMQGNLSDFRVVLDSPVYTADFTPPTAPLEAITGTSLLLSGNNAAVRDESQTAEKLTVHGSVPSSDSSPYGSGKSMDFSGSYITSSDGIDFSDNDFTIELWWYPTDTGRQGLFHGSYGADWSIGIDYNSTYNNPTLGFWASSNGSSWDIANSDPGGNGITTGSPTQNAWNHIAYVRNGSTLTMYLNGVNVGEVTGVTAPIHSKTNTHQQSIGTWWKATGWGGGPMSGNVADYRISLEAVYTENFSVPTAPLGDYSETVDSPEPAPSIVTEGLVFHVDAGDTSSYSGTGNWIDLTGNGGDATLANGMSFDAANGGSFAIDGVDDFAQFPSTALVNGNGAFTNEFWFKWSGAGGPQVIFGYGNDTGPHAVNVSTVTNNKFRFEFGSGAGIIDSTTTINTGTWYHAAVAYDQSSVKVYINGVLEATTAYSSANVPLSGYGGENGSIGALFSTWGNVSAGGTRRYGTFGGNVSVVRQYNRALDETEILFNYNASKDRY